MIKLPDLNTKSFEILKFIGTHSYVMPAVIWQYYSGTNLYGRDGIFKQFCVKHGKYWCLTAETAEAMRKIGVNVSFRPKIQPPSLSELSETEIPDLSTNNAEHIPCAEDLMLEQADLDTTKNYKSKQNIDEINAHDPSSKMNDAQKQTELQVVIKELLAAREAEQLINTEVNRIFQQQSIAKDKVNQLTSQLRKLLNV